MMQKTIVGAALAAAILGAPTAQAATYVEAGGWTLSDILFGKQYSGNVTAIRVDSGDVERQTYPIQARTPNGISLRLAQAAVAEDPNLSAALKVRRIAPHNVLWVQTALTGGKVVYYR